MIASIVVTVLTSCGISGSFEVILSECRQSKAKLPWIGVLFVRLGGGEFLLSLSDQCLVRDEIIWQYSHGYTMHFFDLDLFDQQERNPENRIERIRKRRRRRKVKKHFD